MNTNEMHKTFAIGDYIVAIGDLSALKKKRNYRYSFSANVANVKIARLSIVIPYRKLHIEHKIVHDNP